MAILGASQILTNSSVPLLNTTGGIIKMEVLENSGRVGVSNSSDGVLFSVTYTKLLGASESNLIVESYIWSHGDNSGVCGPYIAVAGSRNYNHTYTYSGSGETNPIFGMSWWTSVAAGSVTITAGWSPNNGSSGEAPFTILNQNAGDGDARYRKHVSRLLVMEVIK
jgi:hypothetical protein